MARPVDAAELLQQLQRVMTTGAGVVRTGASLHDAAVGLAAVGTAASGAILADPGAAALREVANLVACGSALVAAAETRTESRGNHWRADHPSQDESQRHRLVVLGG